MGVSKGSAHSHKGAAPDDIIVSARTTLLCPVSHDPGLWRGRWVWGYSRPAGLKPKMDDG